jgi:hypothetical protein
LNRSIIRTFTSKKISESVELETTKQLIEWYSMAYESLITKFPNQHIRVDFKKLIQQNTDEIKRISNFLSLPLNDLVLPVNNSVKAHKSINPYERLTKENLAPILLKLPFMNEYCN